MATSPDLLTTSRNAKLSDNPDYPCPRRSGISNSICNPHLDDILPSSTFDLRREAKGREQKRREEPLSSSTMLTEYF